MMVISIAVCSKDQTIAVIGYGSQGHAQAQNLKDSGYHVIIGLHDESKSKEKAKADGFVVDNPATVAQKANVIQILTPDQNQAQLYEESIAPHLVEGNSLVFSHGFNIHYELIVPAKNIDVFMIAPKGPGHLVRRVYQKGGGVPCLIAVFQDASGQAKNKALAHAKGVGGGRAGILETTFRDENRDRSIWGTMCFMWWTNLVDCRWL